MSSKAPRGEDVRSLRGDEPSLGDKSRYYVDLFLSWSPFSRFIGLFVLSLVITVVMASLALWVEPAEGEIAGDFLEAMWWALGRVTDAGNMAGDKGTWLRIVAVTATLAGIMVVALLIGLVSSTVADKIDDLRKGKSPVIDSDHTLILGFSEKIYPILRELREANDSRRRAAIVILSMRDKEEVESEVHERMDDMGKTRIVVRQGSPFTPVDLRKVGAHRARSIIVLSSDVGEAEGGSSDPDLNAIKILLALRRIDGVFEKNHVVVELQDGRRTSVMERLGHGGVEVVAMRETLARMMVQTSRQAGLAAIYRDILSFEGAEFYLRPFPELAGVRFGEVQGKLNGGIAIGLRHCDDKGEYRIAINPPRTMLVGPKDALIVLAEDDDSFGLLGAKRPALTFQGPSAFQAPLQVAERILVCGHRSDLETIVADFDAYATPGSRLEIMAGAHAEFQLPQGPFKNLEVALVAGDPATPDGAALIAKGGYTSILHVANDQLVPDEADAITVISLLLLREALDGMAREQRPRIVSEVLDPRTKDLVSSEDSADFVVSSEITSMLLAQVSEQRDLNRVFRELCDPDGSEIYLKSIERYVALGASLAWLDVAAAAAELGEIALGYFRAGMKAQLNPRQDVPVTFTAGDKLIVLAENELESALPRAKKVAA